MTPTTSEQEARELLARIRDLLFRADPGCLGDGVTPAGQPYPIRDEVMDAITRVLTTPQPGDGVPEGCTPADAMMLRQANHALADENSRLQTALQFYADKNHFMLSDPSEWDTVSGEPENLWCDNAGTATVEDGSIARAALPAAPSAKGVA